MWVAVDGALCQDHAQCCQTARAVVRVDADGRLVVLLAEPARNQGAAVEEAEQLSGRQSIRVEG